MQEKITSGQSYHDKTKGMCKNSMQLFQYDHNFHVEVARATVKLCAHQMTQKENVLIHSRT